MDALAKARTHARLKTIGVKATVMNLSVIRVAIANRKYEGRV